MAATLSSTSTPRFSSNTSWLINPQARRADRQFPDDEKPGSSASRYGRRPFPKLPPARSIRGHRWLPSLPCRSSQERVIRHRVAKETALKRPVSRANSLRTVSMMESPNRRQNSSRYSSRSHSETASIERSNSSRLSFRNSSTRVGPSASAMTSSSSRWSSADQSVLGSRS